MARILDPLTCGFAKVFMYELFTSSFGIPQTGNWKENAHKRRFEKFCLRYKSRIRVSTKVSLTKVLE